MSYDVFYLDYIKFARTTSVNVDTSFRCRLQCPACARQLNPRIKERLAESSDIKEEHFDMLLKTFNQLHLCGQISDPIYHPNFLNLLKSKYDNYKSTQLNIHTNGSGKSMDWWQQVFNVTDNKTKWIFALDGFTQDVANIYRIGTDAENVKEVMVLASKYNLQVEWQYLVFEHNEHQVEDALEFSLNNNIIFSLTRPDRFGYGIDWLKPSTKKEWVNKSNNLTIDTLKYKPITAIRDKVVYKKK
jgi:MoaA/NifB/PqqE/SkfB family radical SAM enzyme